MEGVKKRLLTFGILSLFTITFVIMFAGFSEAAVTCSAENQTILRISGTTNAHGEVYNGIGNYDEEICYDTIFGVAGDGNRVCSGTNKVVGLSGLTNAHAEEPSLSNYATEICYGGLSCRATTGSCLGNESLVVTLSSSTNAHLASNDPGYLQNICCSIGVVGPPPPPPVGNCSITSASWSFNEEVVTEVIEGTLADMIITGGNCSGTDIDFEIWENDFLFDDLVTTINGNFDTLESWTTTWTYEGDDDSGQDPRDYYFKAIVAETGESESSSVLEVSKRPADYCDPVVFCENYYTYTGGSPAAENACVADVCDVSEFSVETFVDDDSFCENGDIDCLCGWNISASSCYTTWEVTPGPTHAECKNDQCIEVPGDGVTTCGVVGSDCSLPPVNHSICVGNSCMIESGPGSDECSTSAECTGDPKHAECNDNMCEIVDGDGINECGVIGWGCDVPPTTHAICLIEMCALELGPGSPECSTGQNCIDNPPPTTTIGKCIYTSTTTGSCADGGFLTSSWTAEWIGDASSREASCRSDSAVIECPAQIQLAFFNLYNMLITLLAIAGIYGIISLRKKH